MKLTTGYSDILISVGSFFLSFYAFIFPIFLLQNIGFNTMTLTGILIFILVTSVIAFLVKIIHRKNYNLFVPFVIFPALACIASIVILVMY